MNAKANEGAKQLAVNEDLPHLLPSRIESSEQQTIEQQQEPPQIQQPHQTPASPHDPELETGIDNTKPLPISYIAKRALSFPSSGHRDAATRMKALRRKLDLMFSNPGIDNTYIYNNDLLHHGTQNVIMAKATESTTLPCTKTHIAPLPSESKSTSSVDALPPTRLSTFASAAAAAAAEHGLQTTSPTGTPKCPVDISTVSKLSADMEMSRCSIYGHSHGVPKLAQSDAYTRSNILATADQNTDSIPLITASQSIPCNSPDDPTPTSLDAVSTGHGLSEHGSNDVAAIERGTSSITNPLLITDTHATSSQYLKEVRTVNTYISELQLQKHNLTLQLNIYRHLLGDRDLIIRDLRRYLRTAQAAVKKAEKKSSVTMADARDTFKPVSDLEQYRMSSSGRLNHSQNNVYIRNHSQIKAHDRTFALTHAQGAIAIGGSSLYAPISFPLSNGNHTAPTSNSSAMQPVQAPAIQQVQPYTHTSSLNLSRALPIHRYRGQTRSPNAPIYPPTIYRSNSNEYHPPYSSYTNFSHPLPTMNGYGQVAQVSTPYDCYRYVQYQQQGPNKQNTLLPPLPNALTNTWSTPAPTLAQGSSAPAKVSSDPEPPILTSYTMNHRQTHHSVLPSLQDSAMHQRPLYHPGQFYHMRHPTPLPSSRLSGREKDNVVLSSDTEPPS
ncbi:hypothetical protein BASA81_007476 [Batrachochytrium salamandrivorans]|nr:hypothetical protein BASA62_004762 [Batrachochytrium salamandrivorans]KAH9254534.1 hypothetical protein BASA81_007476 [Batrachochytrium salamandrivorans]